MDHRRELDDQIIASYRTVARGLDRVMLPRLIQVGLTMPQFKALIAVTAAGPQGISVTELGSELSIGQPSASLIVDQLVRPAYVVRVPDKAERRRVLVTATPKGIDLATELRFGRRSTLYAWLDGVGDEDAEALLKGLRAFALAVEASSSNRVPTS